MPNQVTESLGYLNEFLWKERERLKVEEKEEKINSAASMALEDIKSLGPQASLSEIQDRMIESLNKAAKNEILPEVMPIINSAYNGRIKRWEYNKSESELSKYGEFLTSANPMYGLESVPNAYKGDVIDLINKGKRELVSTEGNKDVLRVYSDMTLNGVKNPMLEEYITSNDMDEKIALENYKFNKDLALIEARGRKDAELANFKASLQGTDPSVLLKLQKNAHEVVESEAKGLLDRTGIKLEKGELASAKYIDWLKNNQEEITKEDDGKFYGEDSGKEYTPQTLNDNIGDNVFVRADALEAFQNWNNKLGSKKLLDDSLTKISTEITKTPEQRYREQMEPVYEEELRAIRHEIKNIFESSDQSPAMLNSKTFISQIVSQVAGDRYKKFKNTKDIYYNMKDSDKRQVAEQMNFIFKKGKQ